MSEQKATRNHQAIGSPSASASIAPVAPDIQNSSDIEATVNATLEQSEPISYDASQSLSVATTGPYHHGDDNHSDGPSTEITPSTITTDARGTENTTPPAITPSPAPNSQPTSDVSQMFMLEETEQLPTYYESQFENHEP